MLDCREFEKRLYEPDEDTAGFDVELLTHAQDCPACREKLAAQQELLNLLGHLDDHLTVPLKVQSGWRRAVRDEAAKRRRGLMYRWAGAVAAVCVLTVGVAGLLAKPRVSDSASMESAQAYYLESDGLSPDEMESAAEAAGPQVDAAYTVACADFSDAEAYLRDLAAEYGGSVTGAGEHAFCVQLTNDMCAEFASALSGIGETSCDLSAKAASDEISILIRLTEAGS